MSLKNRKLYFGFYGFVRQAERPLRATLTYRFQWRAATPTGEGTSATAAKR